MKWGKDRPEDDVLTPLRMAAAAIKEVFDTYVEVGFTEEQAMTLALAFQNRAVERGMEIKNDGQDMGLSE